MIHEYSPLDMFQIIDSKGKVVNKKYEPKLSKDELLKMYKYMLLGRRLDEKAIKLQRSGRMGTYASLRGEEALQIGPALSLEKKDWVFPSYREHIIAVMIGVPLSATYLYFMGNENGVQIPVNTNFFTTSVPVGTQMLHAVGVGMASNIQNDNIISLTYFGDGATSEGDFHEAMNFAGVYKAPTIFICRNNQYAISLPVSRQTASQTIAQKALAYGFPGVLIDGNDVLAMYVATKSAIKRARAGKGPTLIEAYTYRLNPHTTADDPTVYRSEKELKKWEKKDPLIRFELYLKAKKILNSKSKKEFETWATEEITKAVKTAEETARPTVHDLFDYVYETCPPHMKEQEEYLIKFVDEEKKTSTEKIKSNQEPTNKTTKESDEETKESESKLKEPKESAETKSSEGVNKNS